MDESLGVLRPLINEVVRLVSEEGEKMGVPISRASASRFVSKEVPGYEEIVVTFFSDAERSNIVDFFSRLTEFVGAWRRSQSGVAARDFAEHLAVDIMPLEFCRDVRS